ESPAAVLDSVPETETVSTSHFGASLLTVSVEIVVSEKSIFVWKKISDGERSVGTSYITTAAVSVPADVTAIPSLEVSDGELLRLIGEIKSCSPLAIKVARISLLLGST